MAMQMAMQQSQLAMQQAQQRALQQQQSMMAQFQAQQQPRTFQVSRKTLHLAWVLCFVLQVRVPFGVMTGQLLQVTNVLNPQ